MAVPVKSGNNGLIPGIADQFARNMREFRQNSRNRAHAAIRPISGRKQATITPATVGVQGTCWAWSINSDGDGLAQGRNYHAL
jgi:hypothetical protein